MEFFLSFGIINRDQIEDPPQPTPYNFDELYEGVEDFHNFQKVSKSTDILQLYTEDFHILLKDTKTYPGEKWIITFPLPTPLKV